MSETKQAETKKEVPVYLRLMAATYQMWPTGSEVDREMEVRVEEVLDAACALDNVDSLALCAELNDKHREGEAPVYAAAPELLAMLEEMVELHSNYDADEEEPETCDAARSRNRSVRAQRKARTLIATVKGESNE